MSRLPDIISASYVAEAFEWDVRRARRWLQRTQLGAKHGGRWATTPETLRRKFPDMYNQLAKKALGGEAEKREVRVCADCDALGKKVRFYQDETRRMHSDLADVRCRLAETRRELERLRAA